MTSIHRPLLPLLMALLAGCQSQANPAAPEAGSTPAAADAAAKTQPLPPPSDDDGDVHTAEHALQRLTRRLQRDKVYPDGCVGYVIEGDGDGDAPGIAISARERHGNGCPGDPATSPVRDRYLVGPHGKLRWYDPVEGEYVDYRLRRQRLQALQAD